MKLKILWKLFWITQPINTFHWNLMLLICIHFSSSKTTIGLRQDCFELFQRVITEYSPRLKKKLDYTYWSEISREIQIGCTYRNKLISRNGLMWKSAEGSSRLKAQEIGAPGVQNQFAVKPGGADVADEVWGCPLAEIPFPQKWGPSYSFVLNWFDEVHLHCESDPCYTAFNLKCKVHWMHLHRNI